MDGLKVRIQSAPDGILQSCFYIGWNNLTVDNNLLIYDEQIQDLAIKREATFMHQSAWVMCGVQSSFPRLKDTLQFEEYGERKVIVSSLLLLCNLQAKLVGKRNESNQECLLSCP